MVEDDYYYKRDKDLDEKIKKEIRPKGNAKLLLNFDKKSKLDRRTIATTSTNKEKLYILFKRYVKKDWKDISRKNVERFVSSIDNNSNYSEKTKSNYKKLFKQFDKWFNKGEECSDRTRWIKATPLKRKLNTLQRSDLLTDSEKKRLIRATDNKRDCAIISLWLETGLRPKEMRVLTIGSVTFEKEIAYVQVPQDTKTGTRPVPVYYSKIALLDYLNEHPGKSNPKSPLWYNLRLTELVPMSNKGFEDVLRRVKERSKIKKRIYWYLGRHNSYTDKIADGWNEGIIKQFHGIEQGSTVLNRYVHLSGQDVTNKVKEMYGLETKRKNEPVLNIRKCLNCQTENPTSNVRCKKCGYIIDPEIMQKELDKKKESELEVSKLKDEMIGFKEQMVKLLANTNQTEEIYDDAFTEAHIKFKEDIFNNTEGFNNLLNEIMDKKLKELGVSKEVFIKAQKLQEEEQKK